MSWTIWEHVETCERREASRVGARPGETNAEADTRIRAVACTCRRDIAADLRPLLAPFHRRELTDEVIGEMRDVVRRYGDEKRRTFGAFSFLILVHQSPLDRSHVDVAIMHEHGPWDGPEARW